MNKPEIMAPAGSFASLSAAINAGCDSVFFGVEQLNMRARSSHNFQLEDLEKIKDQARKARVKTYIALNTLLYDHDMSLMKQIMDAAKTAGIDAVIVADVAALQYAAQIGMPIHASTQLSISNFEAVKFYAQFADTIVLAREVDMEMMKKICRRVQQEQVTGPSGELVKIEVFVHGALCVAQSGRCQMSLIQTNTSAQRGACLQECRKKYRIIDDETGHELLVDNEYVLSPKDLCTIGFLDKLVEAGVSVLKIEGRGRSPEYVDVVVRAYRTALDAFFNGAYTPELVEECMTELRKVYNRGFSDGYYLGKPLPEWSGSYGSQATEERTFVGLVEHYFSKAGVAEIRLQARPLHLGDRIVVMGNATGVAYDSVRSIWLDDKSVESAQHPSIVTVPLSERVRKNDKVYLLQQRCEKTESRA